MRNDWCIFVVECTQCLRVEIILPSTRRNVLVRLFDRVLYVLCKMHQPVDLQGLANRTKQKQ